MKELNKKSKHKLLRKCNAFDLTTCGDSLDDIYEAYKALFELFESIDWSRN